MRRRKGLDIISSHSLPFAMLWLNNPSGLLLVFWSIALKDWPGSTSTEKCISIFSSGIIDEILPDGKLTMGGKSKASSASAGGEFGDDALKNKYVWILVLYQVNMEGSVYSITQYCSVNPISGKQCCIELYTVVGDLIHLYVGLICCCD